MNKEKREGLIELSRRSFLTTSLMALPAVTLASSKSEQNWPGFRGPGAQGIADGYPTRAAWNADAAAGKALGRVMARRDSWPGAFQSDHLGRPDLCRHGCSAVRQSAAAHRLLRRCQTRAGQ